MAIILTAITIMLLSVATAFGFADAAQHTPSAADEVCIANVINKFNMTEFKDFGGCVYIRGRANYDLITVEDIHMIWCNRTIIVFAKVTVS